MKREYVALFSAISTSERLADLPDDAARVFYTWLLAHCDVWGRITARARKLKADVWPMLEHDVAATQRAVDACVAGRLLELHELDGVQWLQVPSADWEEKAGRLTAPNRRGKSEFPDGTSETLVRPGGAVRPAELRSNSGVLRSTPATAETPRSTPLRREEKREEENRTTPSPPGRRGDLDSILAVVQSVSGAAGATDVQASVRSALEQSGFAVESQHRVPNRGDGRPGFIDLRVLSDPPCWIEIDRSSPREKSVTKLRGVEGLRVIVLRSGKRGRSATRPDGIDAIVGLGGMDPPTPDFRAQEDRAALERRVELAWCERNTGEIEVPSGSKPGTTIRKIGLLRRYPGFEAARAELAAAATSNGEHQTAGGLQTSNGALVTSAGGGA